MRVTKVELTYFKPDSGKFYSSGSYESKLEHVFEIHNEVTSMHAARQLPDLREGHSPFIVHVKTDHPQDYPKLVV